MGVLAEDLRSDIKAIAEGHSALRDEMKVEFAAVRIETEAIRLELEMIRWSFPLYAETSKKRSGATNWPSSKPA